MQLIPVSLLCFYLERSRSVTRLKEPDHDICIKGDAIEVKSFVATLRKVLTGNEAALANVTLAALQPISAKQAHSISVIFTQLLPQTEDIE
jgi:hypothetical protein